MSSEYAQQVQSALAKYTATLSGAQWVTKAMHPVQGGPIGVPDSAHMPVLLPEYKTTTTITKPVSLPADENWSCCIVGIPSDTVPLVWSAGPSALDYRTTVATSTGILRNTDVAFASDVALGQIVAPGVVTADQTFRYRTSVENPSAFRHIAKSVTAYAVGSDLYNQGTVFAGVYSRRVEPGNNVVTDDFGTPWVIVGTTVAEVPLAEEDMAIMTPNFYTAPARDGAYAVHRLTGPVQEFAEKRDVALYRDNNGIPGYLITDSTSKSPNIGTIVRFKLGSGAIAPGLFDYTPSSAIDEHCSFSVMIFRGLHPNMSITVKSVSCLELVPSTTSPSRQFVVPSAKYDPVAMQAYYALANEIPPVMAAKHNFLGTLLPLIGSVLPKVLPFLAPVANALVGAATRKIDQVAQPAPAPAPAPRPRRKKARRAPSVSSRASRGSRTPRVRIARRKR